MRLKRVLVPVLYMLLMYILGLWLLSDVNKCSDSVSRTALAEREQVKSSFSTAIYVTVLGIYLFWCPKFTKTQSKHYGMRSNLEPSTLCPQKNGPPLSMFKMMMMIFCRWPQCAVVIEQ